MNENIVDELKGTARNPTAEDYAYVRGIVTRLEEAGRGQVNVSELRTFWRSFDRIWPGPNRWDFRLLTFMAGALFAIAVQFSIFLLVDLVPSGRTRLQAVEIKVQALTDRPALMAR